MLAPPLDRALWISAQLLLAALLAAGCVSPLGGRDLSVGAGLSLLPNIGGSLHGSQVMREGPDWTLSGELEFTQQSLDESSFADDGNPAAGDWTQVQLGLKWAAAPVDRRSWTHRAGAAWFRARGKPNIINTPGDYLGGYYGFGYETRFSEHLSMGPEVSVLAAIHEGTWDLSLVPQFAWRIIWHL